MPAAQNRSGETPQSLAALVLPFYPAELKSDAVLGGAGPPKTHEPSTHNVCAAVLARTAAGEPELLLAGFGSPWIQAVLQVLRLQPNGGLEVVWTAPESWLIMGWSCDITPHIAPDGRVEWLTQFGVHRTTNDWLFRWTGQELLPVSPMRAQDEQPWRRTPSASSRPSELESPWFDVRFNDGLNLGEPQAFSQIGPTSVYRRVGARFELDREVLVALEFEQRANRSPEDFGGFDVDEPRRSGYRLRVTNGRVGGRNRTSGARIFINGTLVAGPEHFHPDVPFVDVAIPDGLIVEENGIAVKLAGRTGDRLFVMIE
jgi:hypothetical protein